MAARHALIALATLGLTSGAAAQPSGLLADDERVMDGGIDGPVQPDPDRVGEIVVIGSPYSLAERSLPGQLSPRQRYQYRRLFLDLDQGRVEAARARLAAMPRGLLHATAEAELLLASRGGRPAIASFLEQHPDMPQARQLAELARRERGEPLPSLPAARRLTPVSLVPPLQPRAARASSPGDTALAAEGQRLLAAKKIAGLEALVRAAGPDTSPEVRAEWAWRAAWDRYLDQGDEDAIRLGALAAEGRGEWAGMGHWVAGLGAFRLDRFEPAGQHFDAVQRHFVAADRGAAAAYWAARAHIRAGRPDLADERLRVALNQPDSFYGLLAHRALGLEPPLNWQEPDFIQADWNTLAALPGARRAAALAEIGQGARADRELRHLATMTGPEHYEPMLRLAGRLDLPATQYWLAQNPPPGQMPPMAARLPRPGWEPLNGWRVDRNLVFAHAMQESRFIVSARSPAGARGLMQVMPGTARDLSRRLAVSVDDEQLADPVFNVEFGQAYLEMMRDSPHTGGLLPKVIAAYNAGPGSVQRWNAGGIRDGGDVLTWIESVPFRETRHYVGVVMRNYWLYETRDAWAAARSGQPATPSRDASLTAIAENRWPHFPADR